MRSGVALLLFLMLSPSPATAQSTGDADNSVRVGDQWTYNTKDEIIGTVTRTYTATVSEINPKEIVTHLTFRGTNGTGLVVFDHQWNRTKNGTFEYKPNDGQGVRFPLGLGKEWKSEYFSTNTKSGVTMKASYLSKVTAQETVTTPAGTFDTFKIERQVKEFNTADPSRSTDRQVTVLYAPQINHWVRRTIVERVEKRVRSNEIDELIEFVQKR
jgi:hypothetical protein